MYTYNICIYVNMYIYIYVFLYACIILRKNNDLYI